jgi:hypothetical protein
MGRSGRISVLALWSISAAAAGAVETQPALELVNDEGRVNLSLEDLEALPQRIVVTENEFTDGPVAYTGPLVREVLDHAAFEDVETVRVVAFNDYFIDIPARDFDAYDVIFALEADGVKLSRRDKGPIWLMYPISDHPELRDPVYNSRLVWQVIRLEAL